MNLNVRTEKPPVRRTLAWAVHLLTASGAVIGMVSLVEILAGDFRTAALLMMLALAIDSIDGTLARALDVKEWVPRVDGRRLDDIVDFLNFVVVPVVFMVATGHLTSWVWACIPVLASAYGFSQEESKTPDNFFRGWPSYWNVVAIYAWLFDLTDLAGTLWTLGLSIAIFVPIKYVYPSRVSILKRTTNGLGLAWGLLLAVCIWVPGWSRSYSLPQLSLLYPVYYIALSFWLGGLRDFTRRLGNSDTHR